MSRIEYLVRSRYMCPNKLIYIQKNHLTLSDMKIFLLKNFDPDLFKLYWKIDGVIVQTKRHQKLSRDVKQPLHRLFPSKTVGNMMRVSFRR